MKPSDCERYQTWRQAKGLERLEKQELSNTNERTSEIQSQSIGQSEPSEMYLFKCFKKSGSMADGAGRVRVDYEAEATPLPLDRSELKERSSESKIGFFNAKTTKYYVVLVDNLTRNLWIWDQHAVKGATAKLWAFSHQDADLPQELIAGTLGRDELRSYKFRLIFRGNEPQEFWNAFSTVRG